MRKEDLQQLGVSKIAELAFGGRDEQLPRLGFGFEAKMKLDMKPTAHKQHCCVCGAELRKGDIRVTSLSHLYCLGCIAASIWLKGYKPFHELLSTKHIHSKREEPASYDIQRAKHLEKKVLEEISRL